jgi:hypothetical protein
MFDVMLGSRLDFFVGVGYLFDPAPVFQDLKGLIDSGFALALLVGVTPTFVL